jgi:low affinity Fe/Cu permease
MARVTGRDPRRGIDDGPRGRAPRRVPNFGGVRRIATDGRDAFHRLAYRVADGAGTARAFGAAALVVVVWLVTGPLFGFSDSWQLVINTGTTIVTFLMVFLIQATQNRDARVLHLKLDELIRSNRSARNTLADLEHATDEELDTLEREFHRIRARARRQHGEEPAKQTQ